MNSNSNSTSMSVDYFTAKMEGGFKTIIWADGGWANQQTLDEWFVDWFIHLKNILVSKFLTAL